MCQSKPRNQGGTPSRAPATPDELRFPQRPWPAKLDQVSRDRHPGQVVLRTFRTPLLMDCTMAGFAAFEFIQIDTGVALYTTFATQAEILKANANLRNRGCSNRYVPAGTFSTPSLHTPC